MRECFFQPSATGKEASGFHDTSVQYFMKGDVATRKELYATVVLSVGTTMFKGFLGTHGEGIDGVDSSHCETKVATPIRYVLEDFSCLRTIDQDVATKDRKENLHTVYSANRSELLGRDPGPVRAFGPGYYLSETGRSSTLILHRLGACTPYRDSTT